MSVITVDYAFVIGLLVIKESYYYYYSTSLTQVASKATEFGRITQNNGHYALQGHFKVTDFGTNRKPICDFLFVISTNLHPISHRFQVIVDYWSNFCFRKRSTSLKHNRSG